MDTPLPKPRRATDWAGRWLRRVAALVLLGGAGCQGFGEAAPPAPNQIVGGGVTLAKHEGGLFDWPEWNWHWHDWVYDDDNSPLEDSYVMEGDQTVTVKAPARGTPEARMIIAREAFRRQD